MQLITIAAMFFAVCAVIFALQNNIPVAVTFLLWHFDGSLAIVLLLALALGAFIVALVSTPRTLRRQWAIKRLNKRVSELERASSGQKETDVKVREWLRYLAHHKRDNFANHHDT